MSLGMGFKCLIFEFETLVMRYIHLYNCIQLHIQRYSKHHMLMGWDKPQSTSQYWRDRVLRTHNHPCTICTLQWSQEVAEVSYAYYQ